MHLSDIRALVTGGASGLGRHLVTRLAEAGAKVAFLDLGTERVTAAAAEIGQGVVGLPCNVADEDEVVAAVREAAERLDGLNLLINNAGIFRDGLLVKPDTATGEVRRMSLAQWQQVIDVDLTGPFLCTRALASRMVDADAKGGGVVVNIASISRHGNMGQGNYSAAKAGLHADTVVWAKELARYGIRVATIAPGFIDTPILQGMREDALQMMLKGVPLRRVGQPAEIFAGIKFIIECDYFTGRCIDVDGGLTL